MTDDLERALRRSLAVIEGLERRLASGPEELAVIGLACRFPGAANSEAFWALLRDGVDAVGDIPADRWDVDRYYHPDPDHPGTMNSRRGGFVDDVFGFDAALFGMSPREAARTDPQHRMLLEVTWEAVEHAGISPTALRGSQTGVFVGIAENDYAKIVDDDNARRGWVDPYDATGTGACFASGRISHVLGLHGPNIAVDTGCSSAMVALHQASAALRAGECDLALAGGVHLRLAPETTLALSATSALAPDGRCKPFGAAADGFGRSEGAGVVVLKRLSDAVRDGDPILAVIRGTAVNHDGRASGLTAPNGKAQTLLLRAALAAAGVGPHEVGVVEAHGTGTILGDPIEVAALGEVFGDVAAPVWLGSVKSNIGHTEGAAGIASVIKTVLAIERRTVPPTLHARPRNPHIAWDTLPLRLPDSVQPWPEDRPFAGVSSFGMSGTNAHVVLGPPPPAVALHATGPDTCRPDRAVPRLVLLSARTPEALVRTASRFSEAAAVAAAGGPAAPTLEDLCRTLNTGRARFGQRLAVVARREDSLAEVVRRRLAGAPPLPSRSRPRVAMMFTGQGSTWPRMGSELHRTYAAFRTTFDEVAEMIREVGGPDLGSVLLGGSGDLVRTDVAQPAIFALELALAELWASWGVSPDLVLGHSVGEVAAATVAGVLTRRAAARFIVERGRLMHGLPAGGVMTAVRCDEAIARSVVVGLDEVALAAVNGRADVVLSGPEDAVVVAEDRLAAAGVRTTRLSVSHAFHSPLMRPVHDQVIALAAASGATAARIPLVDNVGAGVDPETLANPAYFGRHLLGTVRFADSVDRARALGVDTFLEVGPKAVLSGQVSQRFADEDDTTRPVVVPSMREGDELTAILEAAAALVESGVEVDLAELSGRGRRVAAPTYPFEHTDHRIRRTPPAARVVQAVQGAFQQCVRGPGATPTALAEAVLGPEVADLADHRIDGRIVVPAALHLALLVDLLRPAGDLADVHLADVVFPAPLMFEDSAAPLVLASLMPSGTEGELTCSAVDPLTGTTTVHAVASLVGPNQDRSGSAGLGSRPDLDRTWSGASGAGAVYDRLDASALQLGPAYRRLVDLRRAPGVVVGDLAAGPGATSGRGPACGHPGVLDAAFQLVEALREDGTEGAGLHLPFRIDRLSLRPDALVTARRAVAQREGDSVSLRLLDATGTVTLLARGFVDAEMPARAPDPAQSRWLLRPTGWPVAAPAPSSARTLLLGGGPEAHELYLALAAWGVAATVVDDLDQGGPWVSALDDAPTVLVVVERDRQPLALTLARVARLVRHLGGLADPPKVRLVTRTERGGVPDPSLWALLALARTVAVEQGELDCRLVDYDALGHDVHAWLTSSARRLPDVLLREGVARRPGHTVLTDLRPPEPRALALASYAGPDKLSVVAGTTGPVGPGEVLINVAASGVNFRDVLITLGMLAEHEGRPPSDAQRERLGFECAGVVAAIGPDVEGLRVGDRVVALGEGTHADQVVVPAWQVVRVPPEVDLVAAAALPMAYLTAAHAFSSVGGLRPGSTVLVHAVTGGVGQAAVRLARGAGAVVHATASLPKHEAARALGVASVHDSRSTSFAEGLLRDTQGRGVDVVLNSLTGEAIPAGLRCVTPGGAFVEIGLVGVWDAGQVAAVRPDVRYVRFELGDVAAADPALVRRLLTPVMEGVAQGRLDPMPLRAYPLDEAADAIRLVQRARHVGKVVLVPARVEGGAGVPHGGSALVSGGLGALGLHAAQVLVERGISRLCLLSRGSPSSSAQLRIDKLLAQGAEVVVVQGDVTVENDVRKALASITADGTPLAGIVHAAGVLDDGLVQDLDHERAQKVLAPKIDGAALLDRLTRPLRPGFFVMFSSVAAHTGIGGQGAYAAANAWLDGLALRRRAEGLPALSIAWGPWSGPGMAAGGRFEQTIPVEMGRLILERLLDAGATLPPTVVVDVEHLVDLRAGFGPDPAEVIRRATPVATEMRRASPSRRRGLLVAHLADIVRRMTGVPARHRLDETTVLAEAGVDSLMLVELRRTLRQDLDVAVAASIVFDHPTLGDLAEALLELLDLGETAPCDTATHPSEPDDPDEIRRMLDAELDSLAEGQ